MKKEVNLQTTETQALNIPVVSVEKQTFLCDYVRGCIYAYIDKGNIVCSKVLECKYKKRLLNL